MPTEFGGPGNAGSRTTSPNPAWAVFSSDHSGNICNVAFADGTVHGISPSINFTIWAYLSGMNDGVEVYFDQ